MCDYDRNLLSMISDFNFDGFYSNNNPNFCWDILYNAYLTCLDQIVPIIDIYNVKEW